jgi:hypothetical protein
MRPKDPYYNYGPQVLWVEADIFGCAYKLIEDASPRNIWHFYAEMDVNDFSLAGFQKFCK